MLITEDYRELNKQLHDSRPDYGTSSHRWVGSVRDFVSEHPEIKTILDYGCGKGLLKKGLYSDAQFNAFGTEVFEYDPAILGKEEMPKPADFVVCTDVLEHIEPIYINGVLDHIASLMGKCGFLTIAIQPAKKSLPDGRNAHILIRPQRWWMKKLMEYFELDLWQNIGEIIVAVRPLPEKERPNKGIHDD